MKIKQWMVYCLLVVLFVSAVAWPLIMAFRMKPEAKQPVITPFPRTVWIKAYSIAGSEEKQWVLTLEWVFSDIDSATLFCENLIGWTP